MRPLAPIALFVYNRPHHVEQTIRSLRDCDLAADTELIIFSDGPKNEEDTARVAEVRSYLRGISGFARVEIREQDVNRGLARSVIEGVTSMLAAHGKAIVLEDDLLFSRNYLSFMNDALNVYEGRPEVFSVSGYLYPIPVPAGYPDDVVLLPRASSWGWATWKNRWEKADWQVKEYEVFFGDKALREGFAQGGEDLVTMLIRQQRGMIDSWAVRWSYAHFRNGAYCLFPVRSKVQNTGNDLSGTHSPSTSRYLTTLSDDPYTLPDPPQVNPAMVRALQKFFRPSPIRKMINYFTLRKP
jgi:glycosyltransferase involved in cell wall biosynthesis